MIIKFEAQIVTTLQLISDKIVCFVLANLVAFENTTDRKPSEITLGLTGVRLLIAYDARPAMIVGDRLYAASGSHACT